MGYPLTDCLPIDYAETTGSTFTLNPLLQQVADLELPAGEYAIFGSGPLLVRGVIDAVSDIDILCRGAAWRCAQELGAAVYLAEQDVDIISIDDGVITIGKTWGYGDFDTDILINSAELIDGLPFVRLEYVVAYKRIANRRKDHEHLQVLQAKGFWPETGQAAR